MTNKPEDYKICNKCGEEYVLNEKDIQKNKVILRHNKKCPNCKHKKRR